MWYFCSVDKGWLYRGSLPVNDTCDPRRIAWIDQDVLMVEIGMEQTRFRGDLDRFDVYDGFQCVLVDVQDP